MAFNEVKHKEFLVSEFTESYLINNPKTLELNSITIYTSGWTIYPPNNEMPVDPVYYDLPVFIKNFKFLETLTLSGIFITHLPNELQALPKLKYVAICLHRKSNVEDICTVLQQIKNLKTINLTGSIISDEVYDKIKKTLPKVHISDLNRNMHDKVDANEN